VECDQSLSWFTPCFNAGGEIKSFNGAKGVSTARFALVDCKRAFICQRIEYCFILLIKSCDEAQKREDGADVIFTKSDLLASWKWS
jgi:hypothetical protein